MCNVDVPVQATTQRKQWKPTAGDIVTCRRPVTCQVEGQTYTIMPGTAGTIAATGSTNSIVELFLPIRLAAQQRRQPYSIQIAHRNLLLMWPAPQFLTPAQQWHQFINVLEHAEYESAYAIKIAIGAGRFRVQLWDSTWRTCYASAPFSELTDAAALAFLLLNTYRQVALLWNASVDATDV